MNPPENHPATPDSRVISVADLNRRAREVLEGTFPLQWIAGEVSSLTRAASGHVYFTLKDDEAQVRCTLWRNRAQLLPFRLEHGMQVEIRAVVTLYEARGDFQLNVDTVRRAGQGNLYEAFLRLKARLEAEGLFASERKRPLPTYPRGIAVVTSPQAAAWQDVLAALARRAPHVPICLYPTAVQGSDAGARIAAALRLAGTRAVQDGTDVLLLVRGGGSLEDLAAFNDEAVARAIRDCPLPVVCGVGHETDVTIADFAADLRAATPTAAAELASAGFHALHERLSLLAGRLNRAMERRLTHAAQRLDRTALRLRHPRERLREAALRLDHLARRLQTAGREPPAHGRNRLDALRLRLSARRPDASRARDRLESLAGRLQRALRIQLERRRARVDALTEHLTHLDPRSVLARGYTITRDARGRVLRNAADAVPGQDIRVEFHDGEADARVMARRLR